MEDAETAVDSFDGSTDEDTLRRVKTLAARRLATAVVLAGLKMET